MVHIWILHSAVFYRVFKLFIKTVYAALFTGYTVKGAFLWYTVCDGTVYDSLGKVQMLKLKKWRIEV